MPGEDAAAIAAALREMAECVDTSFVLDTLQYMWKGGRCSGVTALGANLLKLKPCLQMQEGKLVVGKKYRGPIDKVYRQYVAERFEGKDVLPEHVFITHSGGVAQETLDALVQQVQQAVPGCEVFITQAGCTVSSHCGPARWVCCSCTGVTARKTDRKEDGRHEVSLGRRLYRRAGDPRAHRGAGAPAPVVRPRPLPLSLRPVGAERARLAEARRTPLEGSRPGHDRIMGDMVKKKLPDGNTPEGLRVLVLETCVAECVHWWLAVASLGIFFFWRGGWAVVFCLVYNLLGNLPFQIIQRYNRPRLRRLAEKRSRT